MQDPTQHNLVKEDLWKWYGSEKKKNSSCEEDDCEMVKCIYTNTTYCDAMEGASNTINRLFDIPVKLRKSSSGQYLTKSVLHEAPSIEPADFGTPLWKLTLCLLAAWIVIFLCLMKVKRITKNLENDDWSNRTGFYTLLLFHLIAVIAGNKV